MANQTVDASEEEKEFFIETVSKDELGNVVRTADDNTIYNSTVKRVSKEEYEKVAAARTIETIERSYCVWVFGKHRFTVTVTIEFEFEFH